MSPAIWKSTNISLDLEEEELYLPQGSPKGSSAIFFSSLSHDSKYMNIEQYNPVGASQSVLTPIKLPEYWLNKPVYNPGTSRRRYFFLNPASV